MIQKVSQFLNFKKCQLKANKKNSAWCLTREQEKKEVMNEAMYKNLWKYCNSKTKTEPKTTLNKELRITNGKLCENARAALVERKLGYLGKISKTCLCLAIYDL